MTLPIQLDRRTILRSLAAFTGAAYAPAWLAQPAPPARLPPRLPGELDIHHIDTGRGNCTLILTPDGTSLMIDAGAANAPEATSGLPRPNATRSPGEWQARYALRHLANPRLDFFLATHIHPDHIGDVDSGSPTAPSGAYKLTGVSFVDRLLPIHTLIDRGFPSYGVAAPDQVPFARNYLAFLAERTRTERAVLRAQVGSTTQIALADPSRFPTFRTRILSASGVVWNPTTQTAQPPPPGLHGENIFSIALRLDYGRFSYYTGGDLTCDTADGREPGMDIETPVAQACGRVEVAAANHHGYFDACGPEFVRLLNPQAFILQAWDISHPGTAQIQRMLGAWSPGNTVRDVFATDLQPANQLINRRFVPQLRSRRGHVVIRVAPGGDTFRIFTLDSTVEEGNLTATFGPYRCRA